MIDGAVLTNPVTPSAQADRATQPTAVATPLYIIDGVPVDEPPAAPHR
jgi:hypothetical protein